MTGVVRRVVGAIQHRLKIRRCRAALVTLLGLYLFQRLSPEDQKRVLQEVDESFRRMNLYPLYTLSPRPVDDSDGARWATAMYRLGIPTGIPELPWELIIPSRWSDWIDASIYFAFRRHSDETDEAVALLRSLGVTLPDEMARGGRWMREMKERYK